MNFKTDENLPTELGQLLRDAGFDAATVAGQHLSGSTDADIASICQREDRALITLDMDFADVRIYPPDEYPGIVVLRLRYHDKPHVLDVASRLLPMFKTEPLAQRLWIVDEHHIRVRS